MNRRQRAEAAGRRAEDQAADWLATQGWRILDRRVRTPVGEVDLVARRDTLVAFVEVKQRSEGRALDLAIDERRLRRVAAAAEILFNTYCANGEDARIDVILIAPGREPHHLPNVWCG